jgi:hypothetical protein
VDITADVEWKLTGNGPWNIGSDFELIHTPGHTEVSSTQEDAFISRWMHNFTVLSQFLYFELQRQLT